MDSHSESDGNVPPLSGAPTASEADLAAAIADSMNDPAAMALAANSAVAHHEATATRQFDFGQGASAAAAAAAEAAEAERDPPSRARFALLLPPEWRE